MPPSPNKTLRNLLSASLASSLSRNLVWTLGGNLFYAACQWLIWVILARLGSPTIVGQYSLAQAIVFPIVMFAQLQLRSLQATDTRQQTPFGRYLALRVITTIAAAAAIGCSVIWIADAATRLIVLIVGIAKCTESISDVYYGYAQSVEQMHRIAISLIARGLASIVVVTLLLRITHDLGIALMGSGLLWLLILVFYDRTMAPSQWGERRMQWNLPQLNKLGMKALPLGINALLGFAGASLPRFFLFHVAGVRELGLFSILTSLQIVGMVIMVALGQATAPALSRCFQQRDSAGFRRMVGLLMAASLGIGFVLIIGVMVSGDSVIALVFGAQYTGQKTTFVIACVASAFAYSNSILGFIATAANELKAQPWIAALNLLMLAVACQLLIPSMSLVGAAIAMAVANAAAFVCYGIAVHRSWAALRVHAHSLGREATLAA